MTDAIFARSAAADALVELLTNCPEGGTVTYEDMARATNRDIRRRDRHLLATALRAVRNDVSAVFSSIHRVGVQRLRPEEVMLSGRRRIKRIANAAKRGAREMDAVSAERLDPAQRLAHAAIRGVLAGIQAASKPVPQQSSPVVSADPVVRLTG